MVLSCSDGGKLNIKLPKKEYRILFSQDNNINNFSGYHIAECAIVSFAF